MLKWCQWFVVGCVLLDLSGCSLFGKHNFVTQRETEYMRSQTTPPLQVPAGLDRTNVGDDDVVPPALTQSPVQAPGLLPPGSLAEQVATGAVPKTVLKEKIESPAAANTTGSAAVSDNNGPTLTLGESTAVIWKKVGDSLQHAGYVVANQNQKTSVYYILDTPSTFGKVKTDTPIYQLHLQDVNGVAQVFVTDNDGKPIDANTAQRILDDLKDALAGKTPSAVKRFLRNVF